jgi:hypothetical protein
MEGAFSRISVHRIHDVFTLFSLLDALRAAFEEKKSVYEDLRLVIIDSLGVLLGSVLGNAIHENV